MNRETASELAIYRGAETALLDLIRGGRAESRTPIERRQRAMAKLERTKRLLQTLGNPQLRYPTIHVTGTSGKGSTSMMIASILTEAGYRVGLRTSPFLQVATEKLQIDGRLIDAESFGDVTQRALSCAATTFDGVDRIGYAEAWSALSYLWFADRAVDLAVIEVGAGGRFDSTNAIEPVVSVITSVGMDHVVSLGPTIADIAWHKAGIIKSGGSVVVGALPGEARLVVDQIARQLRARIVEAMPPGCRKASTMRGEFQRTNAAIAQAVVGALQEQGYTISETAIRMGIEAARLPGRLEPMPVDQGTKVWIDGAHNVDKIAAVAREAKLLTPENELPVIVLGLLASKDAAPIIDALLPAASAIVTTQPTVVGKTSLPATRLAGLILERGFTGEIVSEPRPASALDYALEIAGTRRTGVLVTGSLYLAGALRRRWYGDDDIVLQRTPWPLSRSSIAYVAPSSV